MTDDLRREGIYWARGLRLEPSDDLAEKKLTFSSQMIPKKLVASGMKRLGLDVASSVSDQSTGHCEISTLEWFGPAQEISWAIITNRWSCRLKHSLKSEDYVCCGSPGS